MPASNNSETRHAALKKAQEGARLLGAGDYQGAIAACIEAIKLDFVSLSASRTLKEADKRLRMASEGPVPAKPTQQLA